MITIGTAKALAQREQKEAVIIISFIDGRYQLVSYGRTRRLCQAAGDIVDDIADRLERGDIRVAPALN